MRPNPGYCPAEAEGRRVKVLLAGDDEGATPREWQADGRGGCRWSIQGDRFDIREYEVI